MNGESLLFPINDFKRNYSHLIYKDAVFLSPHKFIGGPGSSGILLAKKNLLLGNPKPYRLGGGIIDFIDNKT
jgi:selenocysteine lyase/cysteine desulfurase